MIDKFIPKYIYTNIIKLITLPVFGVFIVDFILFYFQPNMSNDCKLP